MDYYITFEHFDGSMTSPTRLLGVHDDIEAIQKLRKQSVHYPQDKITIEAIVQLEGAGQVVKKFTIDPLVQRQRCPKCKKFVRKNKKCSKCLE